MKTRNQELAQTIYEQVNQVSEKHKQKYGTMAHKLPILIRTAGLVQALTFIETRGEPAHNVLLDHLAKTTGQVDRTALVMESRTAGINDYMLLTQRALDALLWYKRFAESILKVRQGDTDSEADEEMEAADAQIPA